MTDFIQDLPLGIEGASPGRVVASLETTPSTPVIPLLDERGHNDPEEHED